MQNGETINVGCVGAGFFSQFHINAWHRLEPVKLAGIADPVATSPRDDGVPVFNSLSTMLSGKSIDVLDIITPPPSHRALIEEALQSETIKVIICQKPFCENIDDAEAVVAAAKQANKSLIVHENFRFQPWFRFIKSQLDSGLIGNVLQATVRLRPGDGQGDDAYLNRQPYFQKMPRFLIHETGVHYIDTFRYLLGDAEAVYADLRRMNPAIKGEDAGHVLFEFPGGVRALLDGNRLLDHAAENLRCTMCEALVEGTRGALTLKGDGSVWHRAFHKATGAQVFTMEATDQFGGDCAYHLQAHVVEHLRQGSELENKAEQYLDVMRQESLIYRSSEEGRKLPIT